MLIFSGSWYIFSRCKFKSSLSEEKRSRNYCCIYFLPLLWVSFFGDSYARWTFFAHLLYLSLFLSFFKESLFISDFIFTFFLLSIFCLLYHIIHGLYSLLFLHFSYFFESFSFVSCPSCQLFFKIVFLSNNFIYAICPIVSIGLLISFSLF